MDVTTFDLIEDQEAKKTSTLFDMEKTGLERGKVAIPRRSDLFLTEQKRH